MAAKSTKKTIVVVVWDDAHGSATRDVTDKELPHAPVVMTTMGWLLRDDEAGISVANEVFYEDGTAYYRGHTFIPRLMVRSVTPFALGRKRPVKAAKVVGDMVVTNEHA